MVHIENVVKWFGENEVLRGVNLDAAQEQATVILGPSGSGKSTLLRCVATLEEYDDGRILVDGEPVGYREQNGRRKRLGDAALSKQRADIGMVFQSFNLFPQLTAMENVMLGLVHVRKVPKREAKERAFEWLSRVGLENRAQHYPYQLSGGQQQRVAIARAVAMQPKLLLLDEVTSALDPELVGEVLKVVKDLALSGITMLIVTHELLFAKEVAREIVFMDEGLVVERGAPADVLSNPQTDRFKTFLKRYENVFMGTTS